MAYTLIASSDAPGGANGATTTGIDTTGADLLVVAFSHWNSVSPVVTDSKGNTWTLLTKYSAHYENAVRIAYCRGGTVGAGHTFTCGVANAFSAVCAVAFSGSAASPFEAESGNSVVYGDPQPGSLTPTVDGCLLLSAMSHRAGEAFTISGGFTELCDVPLVGGSNYGLGFAYLIQGSAAAANPTYDFPSSGDAVSTTLVVFKPGAGGSTVPGITFVGAESITATSANYRVTLDYA